jgi:hypothetical protein
MERNWTRYLVYRKEVVKTTWLFRLGLLICLIVFIAVTRHFWLVGIGKMLVHSAPVEPSDVIVLENYDENYLVFEMAARLVKQGLADEVMVPTTVNRNGDKPGRVAAGFVEVMSSVARIDSFQVIPVRHEEPITLSVARQVAQVLKERGTNSMIVVSPTFRSQRSYLVYESVLEPLGIQVGCVPAEEARNPQNWWQDLHGIQGVGLEFVKLWYYRLWLL